MPIEGRDSIMGKYFLKYEIKIREVEFEKT